MTGWCGKLNRMEDKLIRNLFDYSSKIFGGELQKMFEEEMERYINEVNKDKSEDKMDEPMNIKISEITRRMKNKSLG